MTDFQHTWFDPHESHRKMLPRTLEAPNHGANGKTPFCSPKGNQDWSRHITQGVNWTMVIPRYKEGSENKFKILGKASVRAETRTYGTDSPSRSKSRAHYPSRHCTIPIKRRLNDGLPAHMIRSTRESSEDVAMYTWSTKSMVLIEKLPFAPRRATNIGWDS